MQRERPAEALPPSVSLCLSVLVFAVPAGLLWPPPAAAGAGKADKVAEVDQASALFNRGKVDEALELLRAAVKKRPTLPPARLMLARFHLRAGQGPAARRQLELAAAEAPDHPEIYLTNAGLALAEGRLLEALLGCQTALKLTDTGGWTAEQK